MLHVTFENLFDLDEISGTEDYTSFKYNVHCTCGCTNGAVVGTFEAHHETEYMSVCITKATFYNKDILLLFVESLEKDTTWDCATIIKTAGGRPLRRLLEGRKNWLMIENRYEHDYYFDYDEYNTSEEEKLF